MDADGPPQDAADRAQWERARRKAGEKANDIAAQLLEVYARREAREGFAFARDHDYEQFAGTFPFVVMMSLVTLILTVFPALSLVFE